MKSLLSPLLIGIVVCLSANSSGAATRDCTSTREFVTALEFLRSWKESAVPERDAQAVALKVAAGCTGAAERFIKVTSSLAQSGVGASDAIKAGLDFVARTSVEADTFTLVFVRAFSSEGLDLDLRSSLELARSLSTEFQGNSLGVRDDFEKIIRFCVSEKDLDLPRPQCATLSARLARLGQDWSGGVAAPFLDVFAFLKSEKGPGLPTGRALQFAEELLRGGPDSPQNFIQGYRYAVAEKGLKLSAVDATRFARELSLDPKSVKLANPAEEKSKTN